MPAVVSQVGDGSNHGPDDAAAQQAQSSGNNGDLATFVPHWIEIAEVGGVNNPASEGYVNDPETGDAMVESREAIAALAENSALPAAVHLQAKKVLDLGGIFPVVRVARSAGETRLIYKPSEAYLLEVAALLAIELDQGSIVETIRHGWPILSVAGGSATVTEAGGTNNPAGGGGQ